MRKSLPCLACMLALLLAGFAPGVSAWSNGGYSSDPYNPDYATHDYLLDHALNMLPAAEKATIVHNLSLALYGTEMPDNPDEISDQYYHHVYYNSSEQLTDDSAANRAKDEYDLALSYLQDGDYTNADKRIGAMSHYITDLAVFGHVMGSYTDWGAEEHHSDYESYVRYRTTSYTSSDFDGYLVYDGSLTGMSAYNAVTDIAHAITFGSGDIQSCTWMDSNYSWSNSTFKDSCGASMNLAVNNLAEVLHQLYLDYTSTTANNAPTLNSGSVSPASDNYGATFTYEVTYTDADDNAPSYVYVYIDDSAQSMTEISGAYTVGTIYRYKTSSLSVGSHTYYFTTSDGTDTARLPTSGTYSDPTVTEVENVPEDENENTPSENDNTSPEVTPFVTLTFQKSDGTPLANTAIYYGLSSDQMPHLLGTTDSQGEITSDNSDLGGRTIYFKSSDGSYAGSAYISSTGGGVSSTLTETTASSGAEFPTWVIAAAVVVCGVVGAAVFLIKRGKGGKTDW